MVHIQFYAVHSMALPLPYFKETGRPSIHLVDFEVNLKEWEATLQDLGRPSIQLVHFEGN